MKKMINKKEPVKAQGLVQAQKNQLNFIINCIKSQVLKNKEHDNVFL